ncbi:mannosyltransferase family protein [Tardiphaga sp.]|uniref:mannosyltransferase family protein n=1 Tax=Tardiphaga sp. TaxID=1926292 RepID=UPI0025F64085|nr:mannosyltransferase family protein [Tardiphaga sp.]
MSPPTPLAFDNGVADRSDMLESAGVDTLTGTPADRLTTVVLDGWAERLRRVVPYAQALTIYLGSRLLVFFGVVFGRTYVPLGNDTWLGGTSWYHRLLRWDSEWYGLIAREGYKYNGDPGQTQTVVFYPLYPMLSRFVAGVLRIEIYDALLLVANLASVAAILMLFRLVRERFDDRTALTTVAMISFFPSSIFLSAGYTEPLALLLMVCFFYAIGRQHFLAAALLAGLAIATRSSGIVLCPVLLFELWRSRSPRRFLIEAVPLAIIATSGLWLYMAYLSATFGNPMAFSDGQAAFHENTSMLTRIVSALLLEPLRNINLADMSPAGLDQWFTLIFIGLIVRAWFAGIGRGMALFASLLLLLPYLTLSGGPAGFTSMARFNIVSFPLFLTLTLLSNRWRWAAPAMVGVFGGLLLVYAALFSQWQWVG